MSAPHLLTRTMAASLASGEVCLASVFAELARGGHADAVVEAFAAALPVMDPDPARDAKIMAWRLDDASKEASGA